MIARMVFPLQQRNTTVLRQASGNRCAGNAGSDDDCIEA